MPATMSKLNRSQLIPVLILALSGATSGCKKGDQKACDEAQSVTRQALKTENIDLAKQWRVRAYDKCADGVALQGLDQEIVKTQNEINQRIAKEKAVKAETEQLIKLFTGWAAQHRANPEGAAVNVTCVGPEDDKKKERWCERERSVGGKYKVKVHYWEATPEGFSFSTTAPGPVTCEAIGSATKTGEKHGGAQIGCNITSGTLNGLSALIRHVKDGYFVNIYSPKYPELNSAFQAVIQ